MSFARTSLRAAAVLGATAALTVAGAGAAAAATAVDSKVEGNSVSVTFTLEEGKVLDGDTCGAVLAPTSEAATIGARLASGTLETILETLTSDPSVTVLTDDITGFPAVGLGQFAGIGVTSATASAHNLESNAYALVSFCLSSTEPTIEPFLLVGDPNEAIAGSLNGLSSDGDALGMLSSAIGGEGEDGGQLGMLSSTLGAPTGN